jgi:hypothetical protein
LSAYDQYLSGRIGESKANEECIKESIATLPAVH